MEMNHSPLKIKIFFPSFGNNKIPSVFSGSCCRHSTCDKGREGISNSNPLLLNEPLQSQTYEKFAFWLLI